MDYHRRLISMTRFNAEKVVLDDEGACIFIADYLNWGDTHIQGT